MRKSTHDHIHFVHKTKIPDTESSLDVVDKNIVVGPHPLHKHLENRHVSKKEKIPFMEKVREVCAHLDVFASTHNLPVHVLCIMVSTIIIPVSAIAIIWDFIAAIVFEIPDLSTINTPGFLLFINFIAIPLSMYGYMMEYLMHEKSKLATIGFINVVIHPILFFLRAGIEYVFDGFRSEDKIYFEAFSDVGLPAKYSMGIIRYKEGYPYADSEEPMNYLLKKFANLIMLNDDNELVPIINSGYSLHEDFVEDRSFIDIIEEEEGDEA